MTNNERFHGTIDWVNRPSGYGPGIETDVKRYFTDTVTAIWRSDTEIAIDAQYQSYLYTIQLFSTEPGKFEGGFTARNGNSTSQGVCAARLFLAPTGVFLYGWWCENPETGNKDTWWADLHPETSQ